MKFQTAMLVSLLCVFAFACDDSSDDSDDSGGANAQTGGSSSSAGMSAPSGSQNQIKDFTDDQIDQLCETTIRPFAVYFPLASCLISNAAALATDMCQATAMTCISELPTPSEVDFSMECQDSDDITATTNPACILAECVQGIKDQRDKGCTATEAELLSCVNDTASVQFNPTSITPESICTPSMMSENLMEEEGEPPVSCQQLEMKCPDSEEEGGEEGGAEGGGEGGAEG